MSSRTALPISLYLAERTVVLVGEGPMTDEREVRLREAGANIVRLGPTIRDSDLPQHAFALIANGPDDDANTAAVAIGRERGLLCYAHDQPAISDFAMPALVRRGPLRIAISSGGRAPALSKRLRQELERALESGAEALDPFIDEIAQLRDSLPRERRGELSTEAMRLRLEGKFVVDEKKTPPE